MAITIGTDALERLCARKLTVGLENDAANDFASSAGLASVRTQSSHIRVTVALRNSLTISTVPYQSDLRSDPRQPARCKAAYPRKPTGDEVGRSSFSLAPNSSPS
jgi:ligand-binding sensor protein